MSGKKVVVDTDILSMFAKVDAVDVLESLLEKKRMVMTSAIQRAGVDVGHHRGVAVALLRDEV